MHTFLNPIVSRGADPWFIFKGGWYYYCFVHPDNKNGTIYVTKSCTITDMQYGERVLVWNPPANGKGSTEVWAPELHFINGHWYIYYAAGDDQGVNHRMYVLESIDDDAQGMYECKGKIADSEDGWGIDGTILQKENGELFYIWSGYGEIRPGYTFPEQNLYIAAMENPWTLKGKGVEISTPSYPWETIGPAPVNEGPSVLYKNGKFIIVYSASHSLTDDYCLGAIVNSNGDVLTPESWKKIAEPVFKKTDRVFGPGHASFTTSADGAEDWIVFHAARFSGAGWDRHVHAQKFTWKPDGLPDFGSPIAVDIPIVLPLGDAVTRPEETVQLPAQEGITVS